MSLEDDAVTPVGVADGAEDITPEDSVVSVYLDPTPIEPAEPALDFEVMLAEQAAARASGIAALVGLGLTLEQARAIAGGGA